MRCRNRNPQSTEINPLLSSSSSAPNAVNMHTAPRGKNRNLSRTPGVEKLLAIECTQITTIIVLRLRSTCVSRHLQLRTGVFCWRSFTACMPLLTATSALRRRWSSSHPATVLEPILIYTVSVPYCTQITPFLFISYRLL